MSGAFKMEVLMQGAVYVFDLGMSRRLLEKLETFGEECSPACQTLRADLRRALRIVDGLESAPELQNPFPPDAAEQALIDVARENAEACGDCRVPRCRFCDAAGKRVAGLQDWAGRVTEWFYLCETPNCIAARAATPQPLRLFAGGAV